MTADEAVESWSSVVPVAPFCIRMVIVDDHEQVRRSVTALLEAAGDVVVCGEAASVSEAERVTEATEPDVAVVDLRLGTESGITASRAIRGIRPETHVILLTSASDEQARMAALLAGADGYLVKQLGMGDLVFAVRTAARRGRRPAAPSAVARARSRSLAALRTSCLAGRIGEEDEELLDLVVDGRTNGEIGDALNLGEAVVAGRVEALMSHLVPARAQSGGVHERRSLR